MTSPTAPARAGGDKDEIEIKLPCEDLDAVRKRLVALGAQAVTEMHFETNDLYDDRDGGLSKADSTLRLRRARGETILTYKGPPRFEQGVKRRQERETRVSDGEEGQAILEALGFVRRFRYEKHREEWRLETCLIALDETPIGRFIEVEGDPAEIQRVVVALALDFASAIPYSYARLYAIKRNENPELPQDMVFESRDTEDGRR